MRIRSLARLGGMATGVAVLGLTVSACGLAPYVAKVNGQVITRSQLFGEMDAISGNSADVSNLKSEGVTVHGKAKGSFTTTFADDILDEEISTALVSQGVKKRNVTVTPEITTLARSDVVSAAGGAKTFDAFPKSYRSYVVTSAAQYTALEASVGKVAVTKASVANYYNAHPAELADDCASIIVVSTKAEATTIAKQLKKGVSFASLAESDSADTSTGANGGAAGCSIPAAFSETYGTGVATAVTSQAVGTVSAPIHVYSSSGEAFYILAKVTARKPETLSASTPVILGDLLNPVQTKLTTYLTKLTKAAKVTVDPSYGRFSISSGNPDVLAPKKPPAADLVLPNGTTTTTAPSTATTAPPTTASTAPPTTTKTTTAAKTTTKTTSAAKTTPTAAKTTPTTAAKTTTKTTTKTTPTTKAAAKTGGG